MNKFAAQIIVAAIFLFMFIGFMQIGNVETRSHTYTIGDTVYTSSTATGLLGEVKCSGRADSSGASMECK